MLEYLDIGTLTRDSIIVSKIYIGQRSFRANCVAGCKQREREKEFSLQFKFEKPGRAGICVQLWTDERCQRDER